MPEVVVLGNAQDGGVPHAGCLCRNCSAARADWSRRHLPASIGILSGDDTAIVDTTDAFEEQLHRLWSLRPSSAGHESERYQPPGQVILTHAHTGHYAGLWQFDRSVLAASGVRVTGPPTTIALLQANEPWRKMQAEGFICLEPGAFDVPFEPVPDVFVTLLEVPHRSEWETDTAALLITGPNRTLLYVPDIDRWDEWDRDIAEVTASVDVAVLDGCFWQAPARAGVPHPPILETMDRLQHLVDSRKSEVIFTHLNHSNPVLDPDSPERAEVMRRGYRIAVAGDRIVL